MRSFTLCAKDIILVPILRTGRNKQREREMNWEGRERERGVRQAARQAGRQADRQKQRQKYTERENEEEKRKEDEKYQWVKTEKGEEEVNPPKHRQGDTDREINRLAHTQTDRRSQLA